MQQLAEDDRLISANNTQNKSESLTETTVELCPPPTVGGELELHRLKSEEEEKEWNVKVCTETNVYEEKEKLDHHTEDKKELEKETLHSKGTDGQQN